MSKKMMTLSSGQLSRLTAIEARLEDKILQMAKELTDYHAAVPIDIRRRGLARMILRAASAGCKQAEKITGFPVQVAIKPKPGYVRVYFFPLGDEPPVFSDFSYLLKEGHNA